MTQHYYAPQPQQPAPKKKGSVPQGLKIAAGVVGGIILLGIVGSALSDDEPVAATQPTVTVTATAEAPTPTPEKPKKEEKKATPTPTPTKEAEPTKEPAPTEPEFTREEENAIQSARDYLDFMAFSRQGLIEQLSYDGYPTKTAEKAVDYLDIDWMEQAVKSAEEYLDFMAFSRQGLVDQLLHDGFTRDQAEHGAKEALS